MTGEWLSGLLGYPVDLDEAATALARLGFAVEHDRDTLTDPAAVLPPRRDHP